MRSSILGMAFRLATEQLMEIKSISFHSLGMLQ